MDSVQRVAGKGKSGRLNGFWRHASHIGRQQQAGKTGQPPARGICHARKIGQRVSDLSNLAESCGSGLSLQNAASKRPDATVHFVFYKNRIDPQRSGDRIIFTLRPDGRGLDGHHPKDTRRSSCSLLLWTEGRMPSPSRWHWDSTRRLG